MTSQGWSNHRKNWWHGGMVLLFKLIPGESLAPASEVIIEQPQKKFVIMSWGVYQQQLFFDSLLVSLWHLLIKTVQQFYPHCIATADILKSNTQTSSLQTWSVMHSFLQAKLQIQFFEFSAADSEECNLHR